MAYHVLAEAQYRVAALTSLSADWETSCAALEFLHEQAKVKEHQAACRGYAALFARYAIQGRQGMTAEIFHEVDKNASIWQFSKGSLRLLCFVDRNTVILTNGYVKKRQKVDPLELRRAIAAKDAYFKN